MLHIYQDGNVFYNDSTGDVVFVSSVIVKDFDVEAAIKALAEFTNWAEKIDLDWELV